MFGGDGLFSVQNLSIFSTKIKAVVFDLDDTLYPQVEYKRSGFEVVASWLAEKRGIDSTKVLYELETILDKFGASYPYMFDRLVERLDIDIGFVEQLVRLFIDHDPRICCYDGVIPMLSRLRKKYLLGILTDGRYLVQQKKVKSLGLDNVVARILYSDAMGLEKPATQLYKWFEDAFHTYGLKMLYVGDNPAKDFCGANQRQWYTVQVGTGKRVSKIVAPEYQAKKRISSVTDLESMMTT
jgi:putative hydrolase of the HAD superfamily